MKIAANHPKVLEGQWLPLMEAFYTLQGEGYHKGGAAYFIRIGGCDVGCHWCDVKESWNAELHPPTAVTDIVAEANKYSKTVVVTGGEPLMWNMDPLTTALKKEGRQTHIETSGAYPLSGIWDWFCLSPKKNKMPLEDAYAVADELKIIVHNTDDLRFAAAEAEKVGAACKLFLQPEWSKREKMMPQIVTFVLEHPEWKASLQTHKYLNIP
jgi:7-carboxy-7-deazaguanine synthase